MIVLFAGHIIGDFYLQTQKMADEKEEKLRCVLKHCIVYFVAMLLTTIPFAGLEMLIVVVFAAVIHMIVDVLKFFYVKGLKKKKHSKLKLFLVDQIIHTLTIMIIVYIVVSNNIEFEQLGIFSRIFSVVGVSKREFASWILAILIIHKPSNIFIQKMLSGYKLKVKGDEIKKDNNAGRMIGTIERAIMLMFLSIKQYSAIGLVLTAKSVARYNKIAEDEEFAEYYLLGTLLSAGIVITCGVILF